MVCKEMRDQCIVERVYVLQFFLNDNSWGIYSLEEIIQVFIFKFYFVRFFVRNYERAEKENLFIYLFTFLKKRNTPELEQGCHAR